MVRRARLQLRPTLIAVVWALAASAVAAQESPSTPATATEEMAPQPAASAERPLRKISKGSLSKEEIDRVVRAALPRVLACYEQRLAKRPELAGKLTMAWTIERTGRVTKHSVLADTLNDEKLHTCVGEIVAGLVFPEPRGGGSVFVTYPFVFAPQAKSTAEPKTEGFRWYLPGTWCR